MLKRNVEDIGPLQQSLNSIYRGVIEDNQDPLKAGRCKVRIFSLHTDQKIQDEYEGIPTDHLPWAQPALGISEGSVSGFGLWSVPLQGSHVFVFFENGHIMQPRYFASAPAIPAERPSTERGFSDPDGVYPNTSSSEPTKPNALNESDYHRLSRENTGNTPISYRTKNLVTDIIQADEETWDEPSPAYGAQYPHNIVFATHAGLVIEMDSTPGNERYHIFHPSNTFIEVDSEGNVVVKNPKNKYEIVGENKNIHIMFDHNQSVYGQRTDLVAMDEIRYVGENREETIIENVEQDIGEDKIINIGNDKTITIDNEKDESVGSDHLVNIGGTCYINVTGHCQISSSDRIDIAAGTVHLNTVGPRTPIIRTTEGVKILVDGQEIEYTEVDFGTTADEPDVDNGLNVETEGEEPTEEEIQRSEEIDVSPTTTTEETSAAPGDPSTPVSDCSEIESPVDPYEQLSTNFTVGDLTTGTVVSTYKIQDQAGLTEAEIACNLKALAENILEEILTEYSDYSMIVTSAFRHGSGSSQHHLGKAADIQFPTKTNTEVYEVSLWIKDNLNYDQMILEYGGNRPWIHITYNQDGNRSGSHASKFGTRERPGVYTWGSIKNMA